MSPNDQNMHTMLPTCQSIKLFSHYVPKQFVINIDYPIGERVYHKPPSCLLRLPLPSHSDGLVREGGWGVRPLTPPVAMVVALTSPHNLSPRQLLLWHGRPCPWSLRRLRRRRGSPELFKVFIYLTNLFVCSIIDL